MFKGEKPAMGSGEIYQEFSSNEARNNSSATVPIINFSSRSIKVSLENHKGLLTVS